MSASDAWLALSHVAATLRASVYRLPVTPQHTTPEYIAGACAATALPAFQPASGAVAMTEEEAKQQNQQSGERPRQCCLLWSFSAFLT